MYPFIICNAILHVSREGWPPEEATGVTQAAGDLEDAQLVAQAAEPLVSMSLICKLTNAAPFPPARIAVFREWGGTYSHLSHFRSARRINAFLTGWVSHVLMTMGFFFPSR